MLKNTMITEVTSSSGSMVSARLRLVLNMRMRLPIMSRGARVPMRREIWKTRCTAPVSLDILTISLPVVKRSMLPYEYDWILTNIASRRSRATPSPTWMEKMLFPTASANCNSDSPIMIAEVCKTRFILCCFTPWSIIRWIRRGMERSMHTTAVRKISEITARFQ